MRPARSKIGSVAEPSSVRRRRGTVTDASWPHAGSGPRTSTPGSLPKDGHSRTGVTPRSTSARSRRQGRSGAGSGVDASLRLGTGVRGFACPATLRKTTAARPAPAAIGGGASSRETSAGTESASTTCPAATITSAPGSARPRESAGSARRPRPEARGGENPGGRLTSRWRRVWPSLVSWHTWPRPRRSVTLAALNDDHRPERPHAERVAVLSGNAGSRQSSPASAIARPVAAPQSTGAWPLESIRIPPPGRCRFHGCRRDRGTRRTGGVWPRIAAERRSRRFSSTTRAPWQCCGMRRAVIRHRDC